MSGGGGGGGGGVNWYSSCTHFTHYYCIYRLTFPQFCVQVRNTGGLLCSPFFTVSVICCAPHLKSHATTAFYAFVHLSFYPQLVLIILSHNFGMLL